MTDSITKIRQRINHLREHALDHPLQAIKGIGSISLLVYVSFALLPLLLPQTDTTHFPPYIALPNEDLGLSNFYPLYIFLATNTLLIFGLYLAALAIAGRGGDGFTPPGLQAAEQRRGGDRMLAAIFAFTVLFHLIMFAVPSLLSTDIFDYIRHGRIFAVYGENPLIVPATYFPQDPFFNAGGWVGTGSVYGPLHVYITGAMAWLAGDGFAANLMLFRGFFVVMNLANLVLIWQIAVRVRPGLERKALVFYGWNPFILILVVSNAHNDILMLGLVLAGFLLYLEKRVLLGALCITLAVLVKFIALPILLVYVALAVRKQKELTDRLAVAAGTLAIFAAVTIITYLPLWAGRETFKYMASVGHKANYTIPGLLRDVAAGQMELSFSQTLVQLTLLALLAAYMIWHILGVRDFKGLVSASAGLAFLTPLALFWFQPWYLTLALGLVALRPWRLLYLASLAFSFSLIFFDGFWWHTNVSMDIQMPMRVLVVFGPPILFLLILTARDMLPSAWQEINRWSLEGAGGSRTTGKEIADPSRFRLVIEVAALLAAAAIPMAAVITTSPQLQSFVNLVVVKLQLLLHI